MKRVAVIGGGPKAAALCAKVHCLNQPTRRIELRVFEKERWGAAWTGASGYTDGDQRLCTPAERDVGFPYERGLLDADGVRTLFGTFSWSAFLIERAGAPDGYKDWVDRGRKPPPHGVYAQYLAWVIDRARIATTMGEVTAVEPRNGKWMVTSNHPTTGNPREFGQFDAVVMTGAGPANPGFTRPEDPRITDGVAFWSDPEGFLNRVGNSEEPVVIAGSGGTSAAIAAWIARRQTQRPVIIIGNQAALFTRTESFFENALFSDEDAWAALEPAVRVSVSERLNRGVVWSSVSDILSASRNVRFRPGRVTGMDIQPAVDGAPEELRVEVTDANGPRSTAASLVVDAAGFDAWWFLDLLPPAMQRIAMGSGGVTTPERRKALAAAMTEDLSLPIGHDGLHAPMLSLAQGPGYASLMVLGAMSERILRPYL